MSCNYSATDLGLANGGIYNFDMHVVGSTAYQGINLQPLASITVDGSGITGPFLSTEITSEALQNYVSPTMGGMMNQGMFVNSWFQRAYYNNGANWIESPGGGTSATIKTPGVTFGQGNDLYCDRPDGTQRGWGGYTSAILYSMNIQNRCD